jgi:hypothetical protein
MGEWGLSHYQVHWGELGLCALWEIGLLVLPTELQVTAFLPSEENLVFSLFNGEAGALLWLGMVDGPFCSLGK